MKIKDFKHSPLHWNDLNRTNCILGNIKIDKVQGGYMVFDHSLDKYKLYFKKDKDADRVYKSLDDAKKDVQRMCNEYIQSSLGWLDTKVKYKLDEI